MNQVYTVYNVFLIQKRKVVSILLRHLLLFFQKLKKWMLTSTQEMLRCIRHVQVVPVVRT